MTSQENLRRVPRVWLAAIAAAALLGSIGCVRLARESTAGQVPSAGKGMDTRDRRSRLSTSEVGGTTIGTGHAPPLPPVTPQMIRHLPHGDRTIALTFDACQTRKPAGYDTAIIRILRETQTPATLMLGGRWMETHPEATRDLGQDSLFELGSHSYLHPHMKGLPRERILEELQKTQDVMYRLTGKQGTLFRPPYGEYDENLVRIAGEMGLRCMLWSVVTGDPDRHVTADDIVHTVRREARPGSIIIMHVNGRGWHTAEALPALIEELKTRGYQFVKVSQALSP